jgi:methylated-DNA-[protein]-cysteine S-methyltransferase
MPGVKSFTLVDTSWGPVALVGDDGRLERTALPGLSGDKTVEWVRRVCPGAHFDRDLLPDLRRSIAKYFEGREVTFEVPVLLSSCSPFFARVYQACRQVGYGQLITYGELARRAGKPRAARAVGAAMARNPLPLIVPCHRVVAANCRLGGFSAFGGLDLKRRMLELEGSLPE